MKAERVCPLDGGRAGASDVDNDLLVCLSCRELLYPAELVTRSTRRTRRRYIRAQGPAWVA